MRNEKGAVIYYASNDVVQLTVRVVPAGVPHGALLWSSRCGTMWICGTGATACRWDRVCSNWWPPVLMVVGVALIFISVMVGLIR